MVVGISLALCCQDENETRNGPDLARLLFSTRSSHSYDTQDKVYGILSLVEPSISSLITPDYHLSALKFIQTSQRP
jgi:hypothetical protein